MVCCVEFEYDDLLDIKVGLNKKPKEDENIDNKDKKDNKEKNDNENVENKNTESDNHASKMDFAADKKDKTMDEVNDQGKDEDNEKPNENANKDKKKTETKESKDCKDNKDKKDDSVVDAECELKEDWHLAHLNSISDNTCIELNKCKHIFHARCVSKWFYQSSTCPMCRIQYGILLGKQPQDGVLRCQLIDQHCTGYPSEMRSIHLVWAFPPGFQTKRHNNPGMPYEGENRSGFLPYNKMGVLICKMFLVAFDRLLMFTIDTSLTRQHYYGDNTEGIVWAGIHVKSSTDTSAGLHGFSKDLNATNKYFENVLDELKQRKIEPKDVINNSKYNWTKMGFGFLECEYGDELPPIDNDNDNDKDKVKDKNEEKDDEKGE